MEVEELQQTAHDLFLKQLEVGTWEIEVNKNQKLMDIKNEGLEYKKGQDTITSSKGNNTSDYWKRKCNQCCNMVDDLVQKISKEPDPLKTLTEYLQYVYKVTYTNLHELKTDNENLHTELGEFHTTCGNVFYKDNNELGAYGKNAAFHEANNDQPQQLWHPNITYHEGRICKEIQRLEDLTKMKKRMWDEAQI